MSTHDASPAAVQLPLFAAEKRCTKCGLVLPVSAFGRHRKAKDGLNWWCKACNTAHGRAHYASHSAEKKAYARTYYAAHREQALENSRRWARANAARVRGYKGRYEERHRDELRERRAARSAARVPYRRAYYLAHREAILAQQAVYRRMHMDRLRSYRQSHWQAHRDRLLAQRRARQEDASAEQRAAWRAASRARYHGRREERRNAQRLRRAKLTPEQREHQRRVQQRWRDANRSAVNAAILARTNRYRRSNPERYRNYVRERRARRLGAVGSFTVADVELLSAVQRGRCAYCLASLGDRFHVDHMIALARGGANGLENICLACGPCNHRKNAASAGAFLARLIRLAPRGVQKEV